MSAAFFCMAEAVPALNDDPYPGASRSLAEAVLAICHNLDPQRLSTKGNSYFAKWS